MIRILTGAISEALRDLCRIVFRFITKAFRYIRERAHRSRVWMDSRLPDIRYRNYHDR